MSIVNFLFFRSGSNNLGGPISANSISSLPNEFFDAVNANEATNGDVEYRCFYVKNDSNIDLDRVSIGVVNVVGSGFSVQLGLGTAPINGTEQTIPDENTAPSGVTFRQGTDVYPLIFSLPSFSYKAIWVKRIINSNCPAQSGVKVTIRISAF